MLDAVHADYVAAGADIITANTFPTARHVQEPAGLGGRFEELNRTAVAAARKAVDKADRPVAVAGSMSHMPPLAHRERMAQGAAIERGDRELAEALAEAGSDLLLLEMMAWLPHAEPCLAAARATGLPVFVGMSGYRVDDGHLLTGDPSGPDGGSMPHARESQVFDAFAARLLEGGGAAAGVMHSWVEETPTLLVLQLHF